MLFGYLAAITSIELVTGIIILPQRQTVLVAKQAAEVDLLTQRPAPARHRPGLERGRVRSAGQGVHRPRAAGRGADRAAAAVVDRAQHHPRRRVRAGDRGGHRAPAGATADPDLDRGPLGARPPPRRARGRRLVPADRAWAPASTPPETLVDDAARAAGRDPAAIGMEGRANFTAAGVDAVVGEVEAWRDEGATHLSINTMGAGLPTVDDHLAALTQIAEALALGSS